MGIIINNQQNKRSELQEKLAAELQERAKKKATGDAQTDNITDSKYLEGTRHTSSTAWFWMIIIALSIILAIWVIVR